MNGDNVVALSSFLSALILGVRQAFYTGTFHLGLVIPRQKNFRSNIYRWAWSFFLTIAIGTVLTHFWGAFWSHYFGNLEYIVALSLAIASLVEHVSNSSKLTALLTSGQWPYLLAIVQGIGAFSNISAIYILASDVSFILLSVCALVYFFAYAAIVSLFTLIVRLISQSKPKAGSIIMVILASLSIIICLLHFLFQF